MVEMEWAQASPEEIVELRRQFLEKYEASSNSEEFHPADLVRVKNDDRWLGDFLYNNDLVMKDSVKQLWEALEWRKKFGVNDLSEDNIRMEYVYDGMTFSQGRDLDNKILLIFKSKLYIRGSKDMDDLKRVLIYWIERSFRESKNDQITVIFDMAGTGLSNIDMDYTRYIINIFKYYYPNSLNYILVFDMPWILNATFQIIKKLLPAKAVARLKFVNQKTIKTYISDDNSLVCWGGNNPYEFTYEFEKRHENGSNGSISEVYTKAQDEGNGQLNSLNGVTNGLLANGSTNEGNGHILSNGKITNRKVTFANITPLDSPMSESNSSFLNEGEMLQLSPVDCILFTSNNNEFIGNVEILNVSKKSVTYKIKTTAPDKFRVRPSSGILSPNDTTTINVVLQKGQKIQPINRDKFLVMCIGLPDSGATSTEEIASLWKNVTPNSLDVEQHRLKCALPANITTAIINGSSNMEDSPDMENAHSHLSHHQNGSIRQSGPSGNSLQTTIAKLNENVSRLESQVKFNQQLQWITLLVFLLLSIVIVYILKGEIQNSNSQYCIDNK